jgi:hypothetical protein
MKSITRFLLGAIALGGLACTDEPMRPPAPTPRPGNLVVSLVSPHADDGAIVVEMSGPISANPERTDSTTYMLAYQVRPGVTRLLVAGDLTNGPIAIIPVPDVAGAVRLRAVLLTVSDRGSLVRDHLDGYSLTVTKQ